MYTIIQELSQERKKERMKPTNRILIICIWFRLALNFNNLQIPEDGHMEFVTEID